MKSISRLLCGIVFSTVMMSAAIAAEGKVVSSINTKSYTYVEVFQKGQNIWLASPLVKVKSGNLVRFDEGTMMHNFYSKTLNRTFPSVLFVQQVIVTAEK